MLSWQFLLGNFLVVCIIGAGPDLRMLFPLIMAPVSSLAIINLQNMGELNRQNLYAEHSLSIFLSDHNVARVSPC